MTGLKQQGVYNIFLFIFAVVPSLVLEFDLFPHREKDPTEKLEQFRVLLKKLPPENYNNLRCVLAAFPQSHDQMSWTLWFVLL